MMSAQESSRPVLLTLNYWWHVTRNTVNRPEETNHKAPFETGVPEGTESSNFYACKTINKVQHLPQPFNFYLAILADGNEH